MNGKKRFLIYIMLTSCFVYLSWRVLFTLPFGYGGLSIILGGMLLLAEGLDIFEIFMQSYGVTQREDAKQRHTSKMPEISKDHYPDVDVFVATYNENAELLYKTLTGCLNMEYPKSAQLHIYLCDDGNRREMKELADRLQVNYLTRTEHTFAKAGNLNNAMEHSFSPLIATFDADMIPMRSFLMACVPYFLTKEKVGFVQTPQSFYNPDLFQYVLFSEKNVPNEQDYFFRRVQVARNKSNTPIYAGSNTLLSREALEAVGGFYTKVITEDFATGVLIQNKGYTCYALPQVYASGLSPLDLESLIQQRDRWARGCIQTFRKLKLFSMKGLNFSQKLSYLSCLTYWYSGVKRFIYILSPILLSVWSIVVLDSNLWGLAVFWMPMYLLRYACLGFFFGQVRNVRWSNLYETALCIPLLPSIFLESFGISKKKFAVTKKDGAKENKKYERFWAVPYLFLILLSVIGIIRCVMSIFQTASFGPFLVIFWLVVNLYHLVMSVFFLLGRPIHRKLERAKVYLDCIIFWEKESQMCKTFDLSEGGISILDANDENFPGKEECLQGKEVKIQVSDRHYQSGFYGVWIRKKDGKSSFRITKIKDEDKKQLLYMIHDRVPTLPQTIRQYTGFFDDLKTNIEKRKKVPESPLKGNWEKERKEFNEMDYL